MGCEQGAPRSISNYWSQTISELIDNIDRYSYLRWRLGNLSCFMHFYEISEESKKTYQPLVECLESRHPSWFTSTKIVRAREEFIRKNNSWPIICFKYWIIWWSVVRWSCRGSEINWQTICTAKEIFEWVKVR